MSGSLLIAAGDNAVLQRLTQQLAGRPGLEVFATANSLLWHARRFPPQLVVASTNLPDIGGSDLLDILSVLCPLARLVLCGVDDPGLARAVLASKGQFVPLTSTPDQNLRQIYQALNIEPPALPEEPLEAPSYPEPGWSTSAALSPRQMAVLKQILQQLLWDTAAGFVLLSDTVGMPLLRLGDIAGLRADVTAPLLAPAFYATGEFARQLADRSSQALYLYEGARHNIYAFTIDQRYLLILAIDRTQHAGAPAPIWALAKRAIRHIQQALDTVA
jgi:DNA-binding NarL/FixJ family response regulator